MMDVVVKALKNVYDSEIPISVYDLGLIRDIKVEGNKVKITMIFTSSTMCPMAEMMAVQVKYAVKKALPDHDVEVNLDFNTRWTPRLATPEGRRALVELFGEEYVKALESGRIKIKVDRGNADFNPMEFMRQRVEERYAVFKKWLERNKIA